MKTKKVTQLSGIIIALTIFSAYYACGIQSSAPPTYCNGSSCLTITKVGVGQYQFLYNTDIAVSNPSQPHKIIECLNSSCTDPNLTTATITEYIEGTSYTATFLSPQSSKWQMVLLDNSGEIDWTSLPPYGGPLPQ